MRGNGPVPPGELRKGSEGACNKEILDNKSEVNESNFWSNDVDNTTSLVSIRSSTPATVKEGDGEVMGEEGGLGRESFRRRSLRNSNYRCLM